MVLPGTVHDVSSDLGGVKPHKPGEQNEVPGSSKLPDPTQLLRAENPVPTDLRDAWREYMVNGFKHNEEMFKRTLDAFMKPYNITVGMYIVLFVIGIVFFGLAVFLGLRDARSPVAIGFGGLSVVSFVTFFIRQPVQALEQNLEFITWLGVAFNTYWTRLMYIWNRETVQAELKAETDDYSNMVERLIEKHSQLQGKRPGEKLTETRSATQPETKSKPQSAPEKKPAAA